MKKLFLSTRQPRFQKINDGEHHDAGFPLILTFSRREKEQPLAAIKQRENFSSGIQPGIGGKRGTFLPLPEGEGRGEGKPHVQSLCGVIAGIALLAVVAGCGQKTEPANTPTDAAPEAARAANRVTLTPENLQHVELKTEPAQLGNLGMTVRAAGRLSANLNKTAQVTSTFEGRLAKLNFDVNDRVKVGDVLALVESPELLGRQLEVKAPMDGVIIERHATTGELVDKARSIYTISDPAELWAIADIKERDIAAVKPGQEAAFTVLAYPHEPFHGRVVLLGNQVEPQTRTLEARIVVANPEGKLKPGMFADVEITTTILNNVLVIPDSALQTDGDDETVFVALGENQFEKRVVKLGEEHQGRVQILDGLRAGETVVTAGSFILKSEMLKSEFGEE
jgi:multidrug efflux pump subunit AcrA (membrane-fusion protein)